MAMDVLGSSILDSRPAEAVQVLEASLTLTRRHFPHATEAIGAAEINVASTLQSLGRWDEALVLKREIYARRVTRLGVSHEDTILSGCNLALSLCKLELWEECKPFARDQVLPVARRSLGADHDLTLKLNHNLATALTQDPNRTRDDPRLN